MRVGGVLILPLAGHLAAQFSSSVPHVWRASPPSPRAKVMLKLRNRIIPLSPRRLVTLPGGPLALPRLQGHRQQEQTGGGVWPELKLNEFRQSKVVGGRLASGGNYLLSFM